MKKVLFLIIGVILILAIVDLSITKTFLISKQFTTINELEFDNSCVEDTDCSFEKVVRSCGYFDDGCKNPSNEGFLSVNTKNFDNHIDTWFSQNCETTDNFFGIGGECQPLTFSESRYSPQCIDSQCVKIRKSFLEHIVSSK